MGIDGLSKTRLARMHEVMAGHASSGYAPGIVTAVARRGEAIVDAVGTTALGGDEPIGRDTIFRIASMTKPMLAAATLTLVEECRVRLDEPVDKWLPELAGMRVLRSPDAALDDTVPLNRPVTLRHLLTFTWGSGMLMSPALKAAADELDVLNAPPVPQLGYDTDEWLRRLATLPLVHQPGEGWMYNTGYDVLGALVSRVSGQPLEEFLRERLFGPLGMVDTSFSVPAGKLDRLPVSYLAHPETGALDVWDPGKGESRWRSAPTFPSGAGGLVSTVDDCLAFGRLLLNKGRVDGERILARPTVEAMMTDQLTPAQRAGTIFVPGYFDGRGWGFGGAVITQRAGVSASPGAFGWDGGLGTSLWVDPAEDLVGVLLTQRAGFPLISRVYLDFWTSVYQALDD